MQSKKSKVSFPHHFVYILRSCLVCGIIYTPINVTTGSLYEFSSRVMMHFLYTFKCKMPFNDMHVDSNENALNTKSYLNFIPKTLTLWSVVRKRSLLIPRLD